MKEIMSQDAEKGKVEEEDRIFIYLSYRKE